MRLRFDRRDKSLHTLTPAARLASWTVYAAVVLPVLVPLGWLDHWPGWAVYAPSAERVRLFADWHEVRWSSSAARDGEPRDSSQSGPLPTSRWSLEALAAPIPPEGRFQVAVALAVAQRAGQDDPGAMLAVESRAHRFTGDRDVAYLSGTQEIGVYADSFWLNTRARTLGAW